MEYCPYCMRPATGTRCPHCGGDLSWTGAQNHLPVGTVLTGSGGLRTYALGAALGQGGFGVTYIALELNSKRRVAVKEYFPNQFSYRTENRRDILPVTSQEGPFQTGLRSFLKEAQSSPPWRRCPRWCGSSTTSRPTAPSTW